MKLMTAFALCVFYFDAGGQIIDFPDPELKACILAQSFDINYNPVNVDANSDGEIDISEAASVYVLLANNFYIQNFDGIQYLSNLRDLDASDIGLTNFDTSFVPASVRSLHLRGNMLDFIDCSNLSNLIWLDLTNNQFSSIDVSGMSSLIHLHISENDLSTLDCSSLTNLLSMGCSHNNLVSLILPAAIQDIEISSNQFSGFDFTPYPALAVILCDDNQLATIDLSQSVNLQFLNCSGNLLTTLDVTNSPSLTQLYASYNQLTDLQFYSGGTFDVFKCDHNYLAQLDFSQTHVGELICHDNVLTSLELSQAGPAVIDCSHNSLSNLMIGPSATSVFCANNQLTFLNFPSGSAALYELNCSNNQLQTLDLRNASDASSEYYYLDCSNNHLQTLLIKNNRPEELHFFGNPNISYICADEINLGSIQNLANNYGYVNCVVDSSCELSIDDYPIGHEIRIYPNPTSSIIQVDASLEIDSIIIYNSLGQKLIYIRENLNTIDVSALPSGNYIVEFYSAFGKTMKKLVRI